MASAKKHGNEPPCTMCGDPAAEQCSDCGRELCEDCIHFGHKGSPRCEQRMILR